MQLYWPEGTNQRKHAYHKGLLTGAVRISVVVFVRIDGSKLGAFSKLYSGERKCSLIVTLENLTFEADDALSTTKNTFLMRQCGSCTSKTRVLTQIIHMQIVSRKMHSGCYL